MSSTESRLRRAIFAACRQRGIDSDLRHEIQLGATGKASLTEMTMDDMRKVLDAVNGRRRRRNTDTGRERPPRRAGGEPNRLKGPTGSLPDGPHTSKLRALWISAWWLGVVEDRSDEALGAWIRRQTGLDAARWATPVHSSACIEALKGWMARDGGVDWSPYTGAGKPHHAPGARIMEALWRRLHGAGAVKIGNEDALYSWVIGFRRAPDDYTILPAKVQNQLIRELGRWLGRVESVESRQDHDRKDR